MTIKTNSNLASLFKGVIFFVFREKKRDYLEKLYCFQNTSEHWIIWTVKFLSFFFFWLYHLACGIIVPWPEIKPGLLAVGHRVLTTGAPGNSQFNEESLGKLDPPSLLFFSSFSLCNGELAQLHIKTTVVESLLCPRVSVLLVVWSSSVK